MSNYVAEKETEFVITEDYMQYVRDHKQGFIVSPKLIDIFYDLSDEEIGMLVRNMMNFERGLSLEDLEERLLKIIWKNDILPVLCRNMEKYLEVSVKRREAGRKGGLAKAAKMARKKADQLADSCKSAVKDAVRKSVEVLSGGKNEANQNEELERTSTCEALQMDKYEEMQAANKEVLQGMESAVKGQEMRLEGDGVYCEGNYTDTYAEDAQIAFNEEIDGDYDDFPIAAADAQDEDGECYEDEQCAEEYPDDLVAAAEECSKEEVVMQTIPLSEDQPEFKIKDVFTEDWTLKDAKELISVLKERYQEMIKNIIEGANIKAIKSLAEALQNQYNNLKIDILNGLKDRTAAVRMPEASGWDVCESELNENEARESESGESGKVALCEKNSKKSAQNKGEKNSQNKARKNKRRYYTAKEFAGYDFAHRGKGFFSIGEVLAGV